MGNHKQIKVADEERHKVDKLKEDKHISFKSILNYSRSSLEHRHNSSSNDMAFNLLILYWSTYLEVIMLPNI